MPTHKVITDGVTNTLEYAVKTAVLTAHQRIEDPAAADTTSIVNTVNLTNTTLTLAGQPDVPRNMVVTVVDTTPSITAGIVTIVGKDANGDPAVSTINCAAGAGRSPPSRPPISPRSMVQATRQSQWV